MRSKTRDNRWIALYVLCTGMLLIVPDATVVNVGPSFRHRFTQPPQSRDRAAACKAPRQTCRDPQRGRTPCCECLRVDGLVAHPRSCFTRWALDRATA